jgi:hypothetical protein
MKFLITHLDPARSTRQRFREVVDDAVLGEELGFDIAPELRRSIPSRSLGGQ